MNFIRISVLFCLLLAISCSKKDESFCGDPPPNWLLISINDTANNSLVGSVYTQEYYLELDNTDTDTMSFDFTAEVLKCYTSYALNYITYNGDRTPREYTFEHNILVKR